jgi:long-chain acyl-CoA synthetase
MTGSDIADSVILRLQRESRRAPDRDALVQGNRRWSYAELQDVTDRLALALRQGGCRPGDRIALALGNSASFVLAYLAGLKAGGVVIPVNPGSPLEALAIILRDCSPTVAFVEPRHHALIAPLSANLPMLRWVYIAGTDATPRREGDLRVIGLEACLRRTATGAPCELPSAPSLAMIVYTSGTTGLPKGVMLTHGNLAAIATAGRGLIALQAGDRIGVINPLFHLYGLREIDAVLGAGATVVLPSHPTFPARVLDQLHGERVTGLSAVPSSLTLFLDRFRPQFAACADHLRCLTTGTAYTSKDLLTSLRAILPSTRLFVTYGLTENSRVCWREVVDPQSDQEDGAVGRPYPGVEVWLIDPTDGLGRVALRSPMVMQGYWNRPEATHEVLRPDGALLTPDLGRLDDNGMLYLLGRIDEVINRGGEKVSPEEVEGVLCQHPAVGAAAVFAAPDPAGVLGEVVQAVVVCHPGATVTVQELIQHATARLEPYKVPRAIEFAERLPRALLGKVRRRVLREGERHPGGQEP